MAIVANGITVAPALAAAERLAAEHGVEAAVVDAHTVRPFDSDGLCRLAARTGRLLVAEEHNVIGGVASACADALVDGRVPGVSVKRLGMPADEYSLIGPPTALYQHYGLDARRHRRRRGGTDGGTMTPERFADGCAWIEGEYVPIGEARIPILDAGFVRSDLTYDVVGVWHGRFFRLEDHLTRLEEGCGKLRLTLPRPRDEIREIMVEVVRRSGLREAYVEAVVTRGVPRPGERDPRRWTPRLYVYAIPYVWIVRPELQEEGTNVVVAEHTRRIPADSVDPTVKNFHWGDLVRGLFEAYDRDAWLPILTDGEGRVTEGPGFNVFAVVGGRAVHAGARCARGDHAQDRDRDRPRTGARGARRGDAGLTPLCVRRDLSHEHRRRGHARRHARRKARRLRRRPVR